MPMALQRPGIHRAGDETERQEMHEVLTAEHASIQWRARLAKHRFRHRARPAASNLNLIAEQQ